jgi:hypothetical protein
VGQPVIDVLGLVDGVRSSRDPKPVRDPPEKSGARRRFDDFGLGFDLRFGLGRQVYVLARPLEIPPTVGAELLVVGVARSARLADDHVEMTSTRCGM